MSDNTMHANLRAATNTDLAAIDVAELERNVVGAAGVEQYGDCGLLRSAVVAQSDRENGLGGKLVEERLEWSRAQGISDVFLLPRTAPRFFEKLGFQASGPHRRPSEVQSAPEFKSVCPSTAAVMRLSL